MRNETHAKPITVLAYDNTWFSKYGGISTFNRKLCIALAAEGARVYCAVENLAASEHKHAAQHGVTLIDGWEGSEGAPELPDGVVPDVIIGHGRITGPIAHTTKLSYFRDAKRYHFIHTAPDELEPHRIDRGGVRGPSAEERRREELKLSVRADRVFAVGLGCTNATYATWRLSRKRRRPN